MKITDLSLKNFLTIGEANINLADRGLHLVHGINEEDSSASSNGSGKSSLVADALLWCLFGETSRKDLKADQVVNNKAKKNCQVKASLVEGDTTYVVTRYRKDSAHKNALMLHAVTGGSTVDMTRGTEAETQKLIEQILGSTMEVFLASVCCAQERMPDLPRMSDRPLKTLVEEAAGLSRIERAYSIANADLKKAETALADFLKVDAVKTARLTSLQGVRVTLEASAAQWAITQQQKIDEKGLEVKGTSNALLGMQKWVKSQESAAEQALKETNEAQRKISSITAAVNNAHRLRQMAFQLQRQVDVQGLNAAKAAVASAQEALKNVEARVGTPCGECGKPLEAHDLDTARKHLAEELERAEDRYAALTISVRNAALKAKAAVEEANKAESEIPDVTALNAVIAANAPLLNEVTAKQAEIKRAEGDVRKLMRDFAALQAEPNPHDVMLQDTEREAKQLESELAAMQAKREELEQAVLVAQQVVAAFAPDGVRAEILDSVTPFLNDRTARYLGVLSDGNLAASWTTLTRTAAGAVKEKFCIEASDAKGEKSFAGLSGGEKRKVRLATVLALQDLTASRATKPLDLWIGDEIDDALDPAGLERLMTILEEKARERGTVVVISHSDLRDWIDNVTIVRKKCDGVSQVEGSLCS